LWENEMEREARGIKGTKVALKKKDRPSEVGENHQV